MLFVFICELNVIVKMKSVQITVTDNSYIMSGPCFNVCHYWFVCCYFYAVELD